MLRRGKPCSTEERGGSRCRRKARAGSTSGEPYARRVASGKSRVMRKPLSPHSHSWRIRFCESNFLSSSFCNKLSLPDQRSALSKQHDMLLVVSPAYTRISLLHDVEDLQDTHVVCHLVNDLRHGRV